LLDKLKLLRLVGLPAETGGVLLGTWDLVNRIIYIAETFWFTPNWVRITADAYAERLAEAVDSIERTAPSNKGQTTEKA
jgi:hypothetical protein